MKTQKLGFAVRVTDIYAFVMLAVFPLFTGLTGYRAITSAKFLFFAAATSAWLLLLAGYEVFELFVRKNGLHRPDAPSMAIAAFMTACSISALLSPYRESVFLGAGRYDGLASLLLYGGIFLGTARYSRPRIAHAAALAVSCTLCCAVAVLQLFDMDALKLFPSGMSYYDHGTFYTGEFLGTIGNTNLLSSFLCLCIPPFAAIFITGEGRKSLLFALPLLPAVFVLAASGVAGGAVGLLACALCAAPVLISSRKRLCRAMALFAAVCAVCGPVLGAERTFENRCLSARLDYAVLAAALCAAAVLAAAAVLLSRKSGREADRRTYLRAVLAVETALAAAGIAAVYFGPWSGGTVYELSRVLHGEIDDSFGSSRIGIWRNVLALVPERLLFGGGPDTLALRLDMTFSRYVPETGKTLCVYVDNAHNEYLGLLVNTGICGLGAYLSGMAITLRRLLSMDSNDIRAFFGLGIICYWVQAFFGLGLCITAPVMWLLWGMVCNYNIEGANS